MDCAKRLECARFIAAIDPDRPGHRVQSRANPGNRSGSTAFQGLSPDVHCGHETSVHARASWTAPVLWRFRSASNAQAKAPEDWRSPKPGGPSGFMDRPDGSSTAHCDQELARSAGLRLGADAVSRDAPGRRPALHFVARSIWSAGDSSPLWAETTRGRHEPHANPTHQSGSTALSRLKIRRVGLVECDNLRISQSLVDHEPRARLGSRARFHVAAKEREIERVVAFRFLGRGQR